MMTHGHIALVDFETAGATPTDDMGSEIIRQLGIVSGGKIKPKLTTLQATSAAKSALDVALRGKDCINASLPAQYASVIADTTMDLNAYNIVIGVSGKKECSSTTISQIGGVANNDGRTVDIFDNVLFGDKKAVQTANAVHEVLHQYGEHHAGKVLSPSGLLGGYLLGSKTRTINMEHYLNRARFMEYSDTEPMGSGNFPPATPLNGPQRNCLYTADRILGNQNSQLKIPVGTKPLTITARQAAAGRYGAIELDGPIMLTSADSHTRALFKQIAVVPHTSTQHSNRTLAGFELMLVDEKRCQVASLGFLGTEDGRKSWKLQVDGQTLSIQLNRDGITMVKA
jgi:hypothetical protein